MAIFKRLTIIADGIPCVRIKDPVAKAYALQYWDFDKDGYVSEDEASQERFITALTNNTEIVTFDEFSKFRYINTSDLSWFSGCTSLKSASLPTRSNTSRTTLPDSCFKGCLSLENVYLQNTIVAIHREVFSGCINLKEFNFSNITYIDIGAFMNTGLRTVTLLEGLTMLGNSAFKNCSSLEKAILRCTISTFSNEVFSNCISLKSCVLFQSTPPNIGWNCFLNVTGMFYVPDNAVTTYKSASGWSGMQSRIKPISEYKGEL